MSMFQWHIKPNSVHEAALVAALRDDPKKLRTGLRDATNRTARTVKKMAIDAIVASVPIKRADIDENKTDHRHGGVHLKLATSEDLTASITISGKRISLSRFLPRPELPIPQKGVRYRTTRKKERESDLAAGARVARQRRRIPRRLQSWITDKSVGRVKADEPFLTWFKSGHLAIVKNLGDYAGKTKGARGGTSNLKELFGPSIPQVAENSDQLKRGLNIDATEIYTKNISSQADRFLGGGL